MGLIRFVPKRSFGAAARVHLACQALWRLDEEDRRHYEHQQPSGADRTRLEQTSGITLSRVNGVHILVATNGRHCPLTWQMVVGCFQKMVHRLHYSGPTSSSNVLAMNTLTIATRSCSRRTMLSKLIGFMMVQRCLFTIYRRARASSFNVTEKFEPPSVLAHSASPLLRCWL